MAMPELPFDIPESLSSYMSQYHSDPEKAIHGLEHHLKKRGMDAVGYLLLSWMHMGNGKTDKALEHAFKARAYAPGSPFLKYIHYFLSHPGGFDAWRPPGFLADESAKETEQGGSSYLLDLDRLIEELSRVENKKISLPKDQSPEEADAELQKTAARAESTTKVADIASETLARIYEKQKRYQQAIETFQILAQTRQHKAEEYASEIARLQELMAKES